MAVSKLIYGLGGPAKVAQALNLERQNPVSLWMHRENIPYRWRTRVSELAAAQGYEMSSAERRALDFD